MPDPMPDPEKQHEATKSALGEYFTRPEDERYRLMIPQLPRETIQLMYSAVNQIEGGTTGVVNTQALLKTMLDAIRTGLQEKATGNKAVNVFTVEGLSK